MKYISNNKIENKRVILRCDFNVPVKDNIILDDSKIIKSLDTIKYLLENNNKVIILSHFGRVKKEEDKITNSLKVVYEYLKKYLDIEFIKDPLNLDQLNESNSNCYLVENTRYTDIPKKESANDLELAKYWASYADVFVMDAFASLHRTHSSTAGLSNYLPTYFGFLVEKEIEGLKDLINNPNDLLVIMGGAKIDDKISIMDAMLKKCTKLIITGGILNTFLKVKGYNIGKSICSVDNEVLDFVKNILEKYHDKILYSEQFIVLRNNENIEVNLNEIEDNDIIYDNIIDLDKMVLNSNMIFMNGTCGKYEEECYSKGTKKLLEALNLRRNVYIGGGDSTSAVNTLMAQNNYKYVSSGGGATLEYVAYGHLKALDYIEENSKN